MFCYRSFCLKIILPFMALAASAVSADDVGLISARLLEQEDRHYELSVDVTPMLVSAVQAPILPTDFTHAPAHYERRGALIHVRYPFTGNRTLHTDDFLLLPWARTGVLLEARWNDGSRKNAMFLTRMEGIPIEIAQLKTIQISLVQKRIQAFLKGFQCFSNDWKCWIPILALGLLFPARRSIRLLFMILAGLSAALTLSDFQPLEISSSYAVGLLLLATLMAIRIPDKRIEPVFILSGGLLGLAQLIQTDPTVRTACVLGMLLLFGGGILILNLFARWFKRPDKQTIVSSLLGAACFAGLLTLIFNQESPVETGKKSPLPLQASGKTTTQAAPRSLTNPFMGFMTIEPYEIRVEIMATGQAITDLLNYPLQNPAQIHITEQTDLKKAAIQNLANRFTLTADGSEITPSLSRGDFLTLGTAGAFTRGDVVNEPLGSAILGLTFVYIRSQPPETITLSWSDLPHDSVPLTMIDPSGNQGAEFTRANFPGIGKTATRSRPWNDQPLRSNGRRGHH